MNVSLVMTVIGDDKPGLVESLSTVIAEHEGNWVESRMAHLAGQFAGILRVQVDQRRAGALAAALETLQQQGLALVIHSDADPPPPATHDLVHLELVGQDHPGIVHKLTQALAAEGVNVEQLVTECVAAPTTGQTLFQARALLRLPPGGDMDRLQHELEQIAADLMVDLALEQRDEQ